MNKTEQFENPHFDNEIEKADREKMKGFNTRAYHWCWWNEAKDLIINQYDRIVNRSGKKYLLGIKAINESGDVITFFEPEP